MFTVRRRVFETNSSSTHSITMCTKSEYDQWANGDVLFAPYRDTQFIPRSVALKDLEKHGVDLAGKSYEEIDSILCEYEYYTEDAYFSGYLESFYETYQPKNGEMIVAFGQYGYDG